MGKIDQKGIEYRIRQAAVELHASQAWLFGSYARGDSEYDSDVDILFVIDSRYASRMQMIHNARNSLRDWHVSKDILVYQEEGFDGWKRVVASSDQPAYKRVCAVYRSLRDISNPFDMTVQTRDKLEHTVRIPSFFTHKVMAEGRMLYG